jgi:RNA polymerase sigma-70 factor (ECF subfamily)
MSARAPASTERETEALFRAQRARLRGLAYRLTGSMEDADDIVQQAFERLVTERPDAPSHELGRWLARVTTNLGIDALRRRKRRGYTGPWLPSPTGDLPDDATDAEARYGLGESATLAFLVALEALSPAQRAVIVLRDVLGSSARETADVLGASEGSVRALHLRARRALGEYDGARAIPSAELRDRHRRALERFMSCLAAGDAAGLEALLADEVRTTTDSGGEYSALDRTLEGRSRVARFYVTAAHNRRDGEPQIELRTVNGLPAAIITLARPVRRQAPRTLIAIELDAADRIRRIHTVLAPRKLSSLA